MSTSDTTIHTKGKRSRDDDSDSTEKKHRKHRLAGKGAGVLLICQDTHQMLLVQGKQSQDPCSPHDKRAHPYTHQPTGTTRYWKYINKGAKWGPPKGRFEAVKDKDDLRNTAVRELFEETGIVIPAHVLNYSRVVTTRSDTIFILKVTRRIRELPLKKITTDDEVFAISWVTLDTAKSLLSNLHLSKCIVSPTVSRYLI